MAPLMIISTISPPRNPSIPAILLINLQNYHRKKGKLTSDEGKMHEESINYVEGLNIGDNHCS
jgi:hypothetical protein